jgi:hypothetical protein
MPNEKWKELKKEVVNTIYFALKNKTKYDILALSVLTHFKNYLCQVYGSENWILDVSPPRIEETPQKRIFVF